MASCANPKKLHRIMDKLPMETAKECAQRFPIKETIDTVTIEDLELLKAYEEEFQHMTEMIDSLLNAKCDTQYVDKIKEKIRKVPCKPEIKYIIKTQENTAKIEALKFESDKKIQQLTDQNKSINEALITAKDQAQKLKIRNIWMWLIVVLLTIFAFRRQIFNIAKK